MIPRQVFVGDHATLVLQLPAAAQNSPDIVITSNSEFLPADPDIDFHKIIYEQRIAGSRLIIEFTPFIPGSLEFPVIEIGDEYFAGLTVTVSKIIDDKTSNVLTGAASTLAIPGTAFMIYGSLAVIIFAFFLVFFFVIKGRKLFKDIIEIIKLNRLFSSLRKSTKRLHKDLFKGTDRRQILDKLSDEFRIFLTNLTGINCRAMTAREFEELKLLREETTVYECTPVFLSDFFKKCDNLRFSGIYIIPNDLLQLLEDIKRFLNILEDLRKKEKKMRQNEEKQ